MVSTFGFISGLFGLEHGIGEVLQGNVVHAGAMISAWPDSPAFRIIGGEPALSIVPNMLITGLLAICVSAAVAVWSLAFVQKKYGGPVLLSLAITQLLVGGGIAPILQLLISSLAAMRINASWKWSCRHIPAAVLNASQAVWPWFFAASLVFCLLLFPGSIILGSLFAGISASLIVNLSYFYPALLILTVLLAFARDAAGSQR